MGKSTRPRHGSLQFWPRKRAERFIPSVNWSSVFDSKTIENSEGLLGFLAYKAGMGSAIVKDNTPNSSTKGKKIVVPITLLEIPNLKVSSVRFYKNKKVLKDVNVSNDKGLKRKVKISKNIKIEDLDKVEGWDDIRVLIYPVMKNIFKKTPDLAEVGINSQDKLGFVKGIVGKEITLQEMLKWKLVDVRGLTKGKGFQGAVKRFGVKLRHHKSEKGLRKVGSIGPWHPARVTFRVPMPGQMGMFTRVHYNLKVVGSGDASDGSVSKKSGIKNYGVIRGSYLLLAGSVQGPAKRQILITPAMRPNKKQTKKDYELLEVKL